MLCACGGSKTRPLAPFDAKAAQLFDDSIEPGAVGLDLEQTRSPVRDPVFRERVKASDAIVKARIATVTGKKDVTGRSVYELSVKVLEVVWGAYPPKQETVSVLIMSSGPSYGVVKAMEGRLVGKDMLMFLKLFGVPDGEGEYHFHASSDAEVVRAAVRESSAYDEKSEGR